MLYANSRSDFRSLIVVFLLSQFSGLRAADPYAPQPPGAVDQAAADTSKQIGTLFAKNCIACHNAKRAEGGLNLESHHALMKGGDSGPAVVAGDPSGSSLLARVISTDDPMPPIGNAVGAKQLNENEVNLVKAWIAAGAPEPVASPATQMKWQPLPASVRPVNALAASADGNYVALGRGNQAFVIRQPMLAGSDQAFSLVDPTVAEVLKNSAGASLPTDPNSLEAAHLDIVQSIAFSPDTSRVAAGGYRSVKIWQRQLAALESVETGIAGAQSVLMAASPDGAHLAVSVDGKALEVIRLANYQSWRSLVAHPAAISGVIWLSPTQFLSCDAAGGYILSSIEGEKSSLQLSGTELPAVKSLAMVAPERLVAATTDGKLVQLSLNLEARTIQAAPLAGPEQVTLVSAGSTGAIAAGSATGVCRLFKREDLSFQKDITTAGPITQMALSSDGKFLVTTAGNAPAQLWKTEDGAAVATLDRDYRYSQLIASATRQVNRQQSLIDRLNGQHGELKKAAEAEQAAVAKVQEMRDKAAEELTKKEAALTAANQVVAEGQKAIADAEAAVAAAMKMLETKKAEMDAKQKAATEATTQKEAAMTQLASREQALATSKDAAARAAARVPEMENNINAEKQRLETIKVQSTEVSQHPENKHQARQLAFSADGSRVVIADETGKLHLFATGTGSPEANLQAVTAVSAVSSTLANRLISLSNTGSLQQWDLGLTWKLERVIGDFENSPFSDRITAMDFSPDGKFLAVGSGPPSRFGDIKIVDVGSGQVVKDLGEAHSDTVLSIRFSPDGRKLASGGADKLCRVFDVESGKQLVSLEGHTHHVLSVAWMDDGVTLATGSADQSIKIWNVDSGTQSRTIGGSSKEVTALAFVGQSNQLIAVDAAAAIRLLDTGGGNQIRAFGGADSAVLAVAVSSDGKFLFAGGQSGNNWVWQIEDAKKLK